MLYLKPALSLFRYSVLQAVEISAVTPPALFCNRDKYPGSLYSSLYVVDPQHSLQVSRYLQL